MASTQDQAKKVCGYAAVDDWVQTDALKVGLGTGSTVKFVVDRFGELLREKNWTKMKVVCTSEKTEKQAKEEIAKGSQMEILEVQDYISGTGQPLDVAIDGADSVDLATGALVKGGGGAHLREKRVEEKASKFIVVIDNSKICTAEKPLGKHFPIPVEIPPLQSASAIQDLSLRIVNALKETDSSSVITDVKLRVGSADKTQKDRFAHEIVLTDNQPLPDDSPDKLTDAKVLNAGKTDNGNYVIDLDIKSGLQDAQAFAQKLEELKKPASSSEEHYRIVEHGLFLNMADQVIIAFPDGHIEKKNFSKL